MLDYNGMLSTWSVILTLRSDSSYMGSVFGYPTQKKSHGFQSGDFACQNVEKLQFMIAPSKSGYWVFISTSIYA